MGTRGLTMVVHKNETKIAQYGQWDHYPSCQGLKILDFLKKADLPTLAKKVAKLRWITKDEIDMVNGMPSWPEKYPYLSRDMGGSILNYVYNAKSFPTGLNNNEAFAGDSLFCEWAYIIDLDKNTFEVYEGFNKNPLEEGERFYGRDGLEKQSEYFPVKLKKKYPLKKLPSDKRFIKELDPVEDEV